MFTRDEVTWNLRDNHFFKVVQLLEGHLAQLIRRAALVEAEAGRDGAGDESGATQLPSEPKLVGERSGRWWRFLHVIIISCTRYVMLANVFAHVIMPCNPWFQTTWFCQ